MLRPKRKELNYRLSSPAKETQSTKCTAGHRNPVLMVLYLEEVRETRGKASLLVPIYLGR